MANTFKSRTKQSTVITDPLRWNHTPTGSPDGLIGKQSAQIGIATATRAKKPKIFRSLRVSGSSLYN
jgi:hypothetical protein